MGNTSATGGYLTPTTPAPPEDDALDDIFTEAAAGITGLPGELVRPRWQINPPAMPKPNVDWCSIGVTEDAPDDMPFTAHIPDAGEEGLGQNQLLRYEQVTVLASFYGPNAHGNAKLLRDGLYVSQNRETLKDQSIYFVATGTIRAVPDLRNTQWYRRFDLSMRFNRGISRSYDVQNLASAQIDAQVDTQSSDIPVDNGV